MLRELKSGEQVPSSCPVCDGDWVYTGSGAHSAFKMCMNAHSILYFMKGGDNARQGG